MIRHKLGSLRDTTIYKALSLMSSSDRKKLSLVVILQFMVSLLDLLGVALVGVLGAVVVAGLGSGVQGNRVTSIIEFLGMQNQSLQFQSAVLGSLVAVLLVLRTLATVIIARRTLFFLSRKAAQLSASLLSRLLSQSYSQIKSESTHSTIFSLTYGVQVVILGVLGVAINTIADLLILLVLGVGLAIVDPLAPKNIALIPPVNNLTPPINNGAANIAVPKALPKAPPVNLPNASNIPFTL